MAPSCEGGGGALRLEEAVAERCARQIMKDNEAAVHLVP